MLERILFTLVSFILFCYIFFLKMIRKNDTTYLLIIIFQAFGILLNLLRILLGIASNAVCITLMYIFSIILPLIVLLLELKNINVSEFIQISLAKMYLKFNKQEKSKQILIKLVSRYDKSYKAHKLLGKIYEQDKKNKKAIDEYVKVLDINPNDYKTYFKITILLYKSRKIDESMEMLKKLIKVKPDFYEANQMLGELLLEKQNYKEAINIYLQAIKYNENKAELYYNLGIAYTKTNEFDLAKKAYEEAVEVDSNFYCAFYRLGQIALLYRDIEQAETYFTQCIYEEYEAKSYYQLAKINMIKNDRNKAIININKSIQLDSKYYKTAIEEPIFLPIKENIESSKEEKTVKESKREKEISDYLDDTYNLTKQLNKKGMNK